MLGQAMLISLIKVRAPMRFQDALDLQHVHGAELEHSDEPLAKLIFLQHTPVYTLGRKTEAQHLPCTEDDLVARTGAEVIKADRGGSVTYHAPGQLTAYMILNLQVWKLGIHEHLDKLEEVAIKTIARFGISGRRVEGMTGAWVGGEKNPEKICAVGVSARRWVTYHGLSLNVDLDLKPFFEVVPCGLAGKGVTSLAKELKRSVNISEAETAMAAAFSEVYGAKIEIGMV
jgi:lipoyl(octanoyl) transferase